MRMWLLAATFLLSSVLAEGQSLLDGAADGGRNRSPHQDHGVVVCWIVLPEINSPPQSVQLTKEIHEQSAGTFGQTAGSAGQTAGSFGQSLDSITTVTPVANGVNPEGTKQTSVRSHPPVWDELANKARLAFPHFELSFEDVPGEELQARLEAAAQAGSLPDILLGSLPAAWRLWNTGLAERFGVVSLSMAGSFPQFEHDFATPSTPPETILLAAPHRENALDFAAWLEDSEPEACTRCTDSASQIPLALAERVLRDVLVGAGPGAAADPAMAEFNPRWLALPEDLQIRFTSTQVRANRRFAVVALRVRAEGSSNFGILHASLVLRTDENGQWRVLQITTSQTATQQQAVWNMLNGYGCEARSGCACEKLQAVAGITQAAPVDGDSHPTAGALVGQP